MTTPQEDQALESWAQDQHKMGYMDGHMLDNLAKKCVAVSRAKGFGDTDVFRDQDAEVLSIVALLRVVHDRVEALRDIPSDEAGPIRYLLLIATECYEAIEALFEEWGKAEAGGPSLPDSLVLQSWYRDALGKPDGVAAEVADILIRLFDFCGRFEVPIGDVTREKHAYNITRPRLHGRESV